MTDTSDEAPLRIEPFEVGQALGAFLFWAAYHADAEEQGALAALIDRRAVPGRLRLVRRLCARYPDPLRERLVRFLRVERADSRY